MRAFEAVGALGRIRRAAIALNLDHAAVSRHIRSLELWAGCPLIDRRRGSGVLTPEGLQFHQRISGALNEIASACFELTRRGDNSHLKLWCVPGLASEYLVGRLDSFYRAYPAIDLEVRPTEGSPDFLRYEADADIRHVSDAQLDQFPLPADVESAVIGRPAVLAVASPSYAATVGTVEKTEDLLPLRLLHETNVTQWRRWFAALGVDAVDIPGPKLWTAALAVNAARDGQGVALASPLLVGADLKSGRLINLTPPRAPPVYLGSYHFRARRDRLREGPVLEFRLWLEKNIRETLQSP